VDTPIPLAVPWEESLDGVLGFEVVSLSGEAAQGRFTVENRHRQPFGVVHGGVYAALAEGLTSGATWQAHGGTKMVMGSSNHTSFLRPVFEGVVTADAVAKHNGRTTAVWEVEFRNADGKLCALTRVTLAIRESG
jgi:1,4-dihydroxy-2-naphthoyl-CoA hydrolase